MKNPPFPDRRRGARAKRILSVRHRLHKRKGKPANDTVHLSTTENMSHSGLLFVTTVPYQVNDIIELRVVMSGVLDVFNGYARVARVEKKETGVVYLVGVEYSNLKLRRKRKTSKSFPF